MNMMDMMAAVAVRAAIDSPFVCRYTSVKKEGMLTPARPDDPLYIIVVVIFRVEVLVRGQNRENEYEKSACRKATPRLLYN